MTNKYSDYAAGSHDFGLMRSSGCLSGRSEPEKPRIFCPLKSGGVGRGVECIGDKCAYSDGAGCLKTCPTPNPGKRCPLPCNVACDTDCGFYKEDHDK